MQPAWLMVAALMTVGACSQAAPPAGQAGSVAPVAIDDVHVTFEKAELLVMYRTRTSSSRDCAAQRAEMPAVWNQLVKARLGEPGLRSVVMVPEDTTGTSVSNTFTKNAHGQWTSPVPCGVVIPLT